MHSKKSEIVVGRHRMQKSCYGCNKRYVGCHSKCRRYADAIEEAAQKKAVIDAAVSVENHMRDYKNRHIDARMRKENWGK